MSPSMSSATSPSMSPSMSPDERNWLTTLASAGATGLITAALPPSRMPAAVRRSLHAFMGLGGAGVAAYGLGRRDAAEGEESSTLPRSAQAGLAAAVGALALLSSVGGAAADGAIERALVRRGVRRPRVWIGVGAAVFALGLDLIGSNVSAPDDQDR